MEGHYLTLTNRENLNITNVTDVEAFDERNIWANIKESAVEISGENLKIERLDLDEGILEVKGKISMFCYVDKKLTKEKSLSKLFHKKI